MKLSEIFKNSAFHFIAKAIGMTIGIFSMALTARYLGQAGFGQYATAFAWLQFAGILVDFGLYMVLLSELGKTDDKKSQEKIIGNLLSLRLITALFVFALAVTLAWLTSYDLIIKLAITILSVALFSQSLNQIITGLFQYKLEMKIGSLVEIVGKILGLILLVVVINQNLGLLMVVGVISIANITNTVLMLKLAGKLFKLRLYFDFPYWKKLTHLAWPLAIVGTFNIFYFKVDTLILSWYQPMVDVGLYAAPYRLLEVLVSLPPLFLGLLLPTLAKNWQNGDFDALKNSINKSINFFHFLIIPASVGVFILAESIIVLVAGAEFASSAKILQLLIIATFFIFYSQLFSYAIVAIGKQKQILKYIIVASIAATTLYFIFIPKYSYLAAAIITIGVEGLVMMAYLLLAKKYIKFKIASWELIKIMTSTAVMALVIYIYSDLPLLLVITIGTIVYGLSLFLTRTTLFKTN